MLLFYCIILLFLYCTLKNKKPLNWNQVLNAIFFNVRQNDDTFRIPGPVQLPFVGTKWNTLFIDNNKLHENYAELNKQYGDIVMEVLGSTPVISLFNRLDIERVLRFPSKFPFRPPTEIVSYYRSSRPDRYSSVGMVNAQGPEWAHLRMKLTPKTLESRKVLSKFCPELNEICDDFITKIKERRNGENVAENVDDVLKSMSFESSCCLILGKRMGFLNESSESKEKKLAAALKNIFKSFRDAYYGKFPNHFFLN
jgi:ecdysone 20-monooxygenase